MKLIKKKEEVQAINRICLCIVTPIEEGMVVDDLQDPLVKQIDKLHIHDIEKTTVCKRYKYKPSIDQ